MSISANFYDLKYTIAKVEIGVAYTLQDSVKLL